MLGYRLQALALAAIQCSVERLNFERLRAIAWAVGSLVFFADWRGRRVALANLEAAFGDRFLPSERWSIARRSYCGFARTMLELFWAPRIDRGFFERRVRVSGTLPDMEGGRGMVFACFHYSNFEYLSLLAPFFLEAGPVIAQRFRNPLLGPIFEKCRTATGMKTIAQEGALVRMFKVLQGGGKFGLLVDLSVDPREGGVVVSSFGGLLMSVTPAHVALAQRTKGLIVPHECRPLSDGGYELMYYPAQRCCAGEPLEVGVQRCWDVLERGIWERPECWLWSYKHWRFKPGFGDVRRYPFYANGARRFDRAVERWMEAGLGTV